jgi:hypothetical protein
MSKHSKKDKPKPTLYVLDTSALCVWLGVPNMDSCQGEQRLTKQSIQVILNSIKRPSEGGLVLPQAVIVETGNHIAQTKGNRSYGLAQELCGLVEGSRNGKTPWIAFDETQLWNTQGFGKLAKDWPNEAAQGLSLADHLIKRIAEHYSQLSTYDVKILTCDDQLAAYSPQQ